jgi:hypothetical protein
MTLLLVKYNGYNVPQREGHYMHTFNDPNDAVSNYIGRLTDSIGGLTDESKR